MYSNKEKLHYFQRLQNSDVAEHDLALLAKRQESNIDKYSRSPRRYADEILYALLDIFPVSIIVKNRREWAKHIEAPTPTDIKGEGTEAPKPTDTEGDGTENPQPTDTEGEGTEVSPEDSKKK